MGFLLETPGFCMVWCQVAAVETEEPQEPEVPEEAAEEAHVFTAFSIGFSEDSVGFRKNVWFP